MPSTSLPTRKPMPAKKTPTKSYRPYIRPQPKKVPERRGISDPADIPNKRVQNTFNGFRNNWRSEAEVAAELAAENQTNQ